MLVGLKLCSVQQRNKACLLPGTDYCWDEEVKIHQYLSFAAKVLLLASKHRRAFLSNCGQNVLARMLNIETVCQDIEYQNWLSVWLIEKHFLLGFGFWGGVFFLRKIFLCIQKYTMYKENQLFAKVMHFFTYHFTTARAFWFKLPDMLCTQTVIQIAYSYDIPAIIKQLDVNKQNGVCKHSFSVNGLVIFHPLILIQY